MQHIAINAKLQSSPLNSHNATTTSSEVCRTLCILIGRMPCKEIAADWRLWRFHLRSSARFHLGNSGHLGERAAGLSGTECLVVLFDMR